MTKYLKIWLFKSSKGLSMIADMQASIQSQTFTKRSTRFLPGDHAARTATPYREARTNSKDATTRNSHCDSVLTSLPSVIEYCDAGRSQAIGNDPKLTMPILPLSHVVCTSS
jgi:hypothetical protein